MWALKLLITSENSDMMSLWILNPFFHSYIEIKWQIFSFQDWTFPSEFLLFDSSFFDKPPMWLKNSRWYRNISTKIKPPPKKSSSPAERTELRFKCNEWSTKALLRWGTFVREGKRKKGNLSSRNETHSKVNGPGLGKNRWQDSVQKTKTAREIEGKIKITFPQPIKPISMNVESPSLIGL